MEQSAELIMLWNQTYKVVVLGCRVHLIDTNARDAFLMA